MRTGVGRGGRNGVWVMGRPPLPLPHLLSVQKKRSRCDPVKIYKKIVQRAFMQSRKTGDYQTIVCRRILGVGWVERSSPHRSGRFGWGERGPPRSLLANRKVSKKVMLVNDEVFEVRPRFVGYGSSPNPRESS